MIRVVVESPYAGDIERNTEYARRCLKDCIKRGEAPIASHLLYTQPGVLNEHDPRERMLGINLGLEWMKAANLVVVYTDLGVSMGMMNAVNFASTYGIPVTYRTLD